MERAEIDSEINALSKEVNDSYKVRLNTQISADISHLDPDEALKYAKAGLEIAEHIKWQKGMAIAYHCFGLAYNRKSDYPKAVENYMEALKINTSINNMTGVMSNVTTIGYIYRVQGNYPRALEFMMKSLEIAQKLDLKSEIGISYINIGNIYNSQKDYKTCLDWYAKAQKIYDEIGDKDGLATIETNMGATLSDLGDYDKALEYMGKALVICEELGFQDRIAMNIFNIGAVYLGRATDTVNKITPTEKTKNVQQAIEYFNKSAAIANKLGLLDYIIQIDEKLSECYSLSENYKESLKYFKEYTVYKDSVFSTTNKAKLAELETRYQTKEKDKQIANQKMQLGYDRKINFSLGACALLFLLLGLLVFRNQRRTSRLNKIVTSQKLELEKLNSVKDRIFSVISHDLRTPVNSLISFTQILENGNIPPEKLQKYAIVLKDNLGYTAGLMENLLNWARTQMQGYKPVFEKFDIEGTINQTLGVLEPEAAKKGISIKNEVGIGIVVFADMNMVSLIIRNLVSNAIKYTPKGGAISINAEQTDMKVSIHIADTGVGIPQKLVDEFNDSTTGQPLESTPGTNKEKGTGLGLMLCKGFAGLMHGRITLVSAPEKGACFTVELPV